MTLSQLIELGIGVYRATCNENLALYVFEQGCRKLGYHYDPILLTSHWLRTPVDDGKTIPE